mmetsp:Transcript_11289/g.29349  ORF Transcript_11289/g.29349 Transcript_11289/m.29349 type:complete len:245 (-) Transcript_11289:59-793(-)
MTETLETFSTGQQSSLALSWHVPKHVDSFFCATMRLFVTPSFHTRLPHPQRRTSQTLEVKGSSEWKKISSPGMRMRLAVTSFSSSRASSLSGSSGLMRGRTNLTYTQVIVAQKSTNMVHQKWAPKVSWTASHDRGNLMRCQSNSSSLPPGSSVEDEFPPPLEAGSAAAAAGAAAGAAAVPLASISKWRSKAWARVKERAWAVARGVLLSPVCAMAMTRRAQAAKPMAPAANRLWPRPRDSSLEA